MAAHAQCVPLCLLRALACAAQLTRPACIAVLFHALTAAHVRRTNVTFAVALQCEAALSHGASDLHTSVFARMSSHLEPGTPGPQPGSPHGGQAAEAEAEAAEVYVLRGRRFAAPGLAAAAATFFGGDSLRPTIVRPLLRSPLLAALGGHKGQDATALALRSKPKGPWKRFKRALHAELAWHRRAWHHAARSVKRCLTPRLRADTRAALHGAGHAFRVVPAGEWLGEAAPPTAALFEVVVQYGWRGRVAAAAFRDSLRNAEHLRGLEHGFAACVAAAEAAQGSGHRDAPPAKQAQLPSLGVRHAGVALVALLDDEPYARLDSKLSARKVADAAPKTNQLGLSPAVAERLATMLQLSLKRKEPGSSRYSFFRRNSQVEAPQPAADAGGAGTRDAGSVALPVLPAATEPSPAQQPLPTAAADVEVWHLGPRADETQASAAEAEASHLAEAMPPAELPEQPLSADAEDRAAAK